MNTIQRILLFTLIVCSYSLQAQQTDTTATFQVDGVCGQCKQRIEKALRVKGVRSATWTIATKMLSVTYNPAVISLDRIHATTAAAGHDTEKQKAKDEVYLALPDCCHYREITGQDEFEKVDTTSHIRGIVYEYRNGQPYPLPGASLIFPGSQSGTRTNDHGEFVLPRGGSEEKIVVSYTGYKTDTVSIAGMNDIEINLEQKRELNAVVITARRRTTYIDNRNPFRITVISKKELLKAACCNLSESFETNPTVDVSYSDAVTGSKQIQLLGLAGNYTQLTVENLPGPRGLATPLGLNSIAGPWVESIQLIKGSGSVVNGFESIAGQINIELKKPRESEKLYLNGYVNSMGKTDVNLNLAHRFNDKWSTGFLLHDDFLYTKQDVNKDGFRDLPTGNQFSGINRWQYLGENGLMSQFGFKLMRDSKTGGATGYDPETDKFSTRNYGLGIETKRYEAFGKIGYVFPDKMYKSVGFEVSAFDHDQDAYFGMRVYNARQKNFYSNLIYQSQLGSEAHQLKGGLSISADNYDEQLDSATYKRSEVVPGIFSEYSFKHANKLDVVVGMRVDHNNLYGWFGTPRLNIRYEPVKGTTIRLSAGRGQRTANIFAENMGPLVSARQVRILNNGDESKAYGLQPEVAWNKGISVDQKFSLFTRDASFGIDFFRNDFVNQVITDLEDPRFVQFYNLSGKSYSNSFQAEATVTPLDKLDLRVAYRYFDVKATYHSILLDKPFTAKNRAFANLAYEWKGWKADYTVNFIGTKRIPYTGSNPTMHQLPSRSPSYVTMNAQLSKSLGRKKTFDLYIGGENLTNYFQKTAILAADEPFGSHFDASMIWGPVSGRLIYGGFRYKLD